MTWAAGAEVVDADSDSEVCCEWTCWVLDYVIGEVVEDVGYGSVVTVFSEIERVAVGAEV